jgi:hypothetical protein
LVAFPVCATIKTGFVFINYFEEQHHWKVPGEGIVQFIPLTSEK